MLLSRHTERGCVPDKMTPILARIFYPNRRAVYASVIVSGSHARGTGVRNVGVVQFICVFRCVSRRVIVVYVLDISLNGASTSAFCAAVRLPADGEVFLSWKRLSFATDLCRHVHRNDLALLHNCGIASFDVSPGSFRKQKPV